MWQRARKLWTDSNVSFQGKATDYFVFVHIKNTNKENCFLKSRYPVTWPGDGDAFSADAGEFADAIDGARRQLLTRTTNKKIKKA